MMRKIDYHNEMEKICSFLKSYLASSGFNKYILGISGGIDSALSAALAVRAIGKENVIGILMPYKHSNPQSLKDGLTLCHSLDISHEVVDISSIVDAYFDTRESEADPLRRGNWMARTRMCVLFDLSAKYRALVVGTSNQSELMTGYFTQYGDSACAIEPIGQLYKTEVWAMARLLDIPRVIIEKTPSADLWQDQSDEGEMGIKYHDLDEILYAITNMDDTSGFDQDKLKTVYKLIARSQFKRVSPPLPELPCSL
jgi:NAD+ synthase